MKKLIRLLCITSFAIIPLFAQDEEPKPPVKEEPKEEVSIELDEDKIIALEETADEITTQDNEKKDETEETEEEAVG